MKKEDVEFLKELQHEMLTQDTVCQASPRFWVVMQTVRKYGIEDIYDYDGSVIIGDEGEECETDVDSMYNWLKDTLDIDCELDFDENNNAYINVYEYTDDNDDVYEEEHLYEAVEITYYLEWVRRYNNYSICNYKDVEEIVPNTMFLTIRECKEHIKANHYHYNKPHTYTMTAWRSPQVEKLYKILENANWDESCEKQIPKVIQFDNNDLNICPICKSHVNTDDKYCRNCGQRIILDLSKEG